MKADPENVLSEISTDSFKDWYQKREEKTNIREGQAQFNGPPPVPPPERHSPSNLLQCHRKIRYRQENAPDEQPSPDGVYWFGTRFEEDIALPYLQERVTDSDTYACNSLWIDCVAETDAGDLRIRGETDPVLVDREGTPLAVTEIKTKQSVDDVESPNPHHRAQVHAYMWGLSQEYERSVTDAVILYGSRTTLEITAFDVQFDPTFWTETVLDWASQQTTYRLEEELPPADPEYGWECGFCSYRNRCGKGETEHRDYEIDGFLPGFDGYPRENVLEYLDANPAEKLTPTLAQQYPDLVEIYGVATWYCSECNSEADWQDVDPDGDPLCPDCAERGTISTLKLR